MKIFIFVTILPKKGFFHLQSTAVLAGKQQGNYVYSAPASCLGFGMELIKSAIL